MLTEHPTETWTPESERTPWASKILVPEMWGAVAIGMMWLAVLFVGVYGPNIERQFEEAPGDAAEDREVAGSTPAPTTQSMALEQGSAPGDGGP